MDHFAHNEVMVALLVNKGAFAARVILRSRSRSVPAAVTPPHAL